MLNGSHWINSQLRINVIEHYCVDMFLLPSEMTSGFMYRLNYVFLPRAPSYVNNVQGTGNSGFKISIGKSLSDLLQLLRADSGTVRTE